MPIKIAILIGKTVLYPQSTLYNTNIYDLSKALVREKIFPIHNYFTYAMPNIILK